MSEAASVRLDRWQVLDFDPGTGSADDAEGWAPIAAPGDVYQALIAVGRLAHPFQGRNETTADWVRDREWWQRTTFIAPAVDEDQTAELVFEGLDTFAEIFLDGEPLGRTDNMFRQYRLKVGGRLKPGATHTLSVRFDPPAQALVKHELPVWGAFTDRVSRSNRNLIRKAQFGWGWDWGPDLPTVGIWKAVELQVRSRARIDDIRFTTLSVSPQFADISIQLDLSPTARDAALTVEVQLTDPEGKTVFASAQPAAENLVFADAVKSPRLWWTADLGAQPLYTLSARLLSGDLLLDDVHRQVGLRTLRLDQSPDPDEPGATFFRFLLNDTPIFAKGACWVPATSFVADVDVPRYRQLIDQAVGANMNMIRVWGGGIYEPDLFYDLCDRAGLLVWQDFMFACAHYPEDDAFAASVTAEVEDQVSRLRHHPCLALWCGANESQAMHRINADMSGDATPLSGLRLYDSVIPDILERLDPVTPYWPGSPWGGPNPNSMRAGDVHDWTVWHGVPPIPDADMTEPFASTPEGVAFTRYAEDTARFVSEFGIQAAPAMATLERWMEPDDLDPESPGFLARIKDEARKAYAMMEPETGPPTGLQQYVDFTQWTQAEGLKFGIEHFRRRRPHCSGALLWQFNDCWPCVSWSLVDFDGVEKAAYYAVRRAFAPVLASFRTGPDGALEAWITNDTLETIGGEAVVTLDRLDGRALSRECVTFSAPAGGHAVVWRGALPMEPDLVLRISSPDGRFVTNRTLSAPIARLALTPDARPTVAFARQTALHINVELEADTYLAFVHVVSRRADLRFSDNHFDLAAGEKRTVEVTAASPFGPDDLTVRCWNDRDS